MRKTMLCQDAMVEITKVNIEPKWGLFNGAIGTGVDITFRQGENPNEGHLPTVVVVNLKHYRGPIWDKDNPTHVPNCTNSTVMRTHVLHKKANTTTDSLGQKNSFTPGA
jgi:hypothetical protein